MKALVLMFIAMTSKWINKLFSKFYCGLNLLILDFSIHEMAYRIA